MSQQPRITISTSDSLSPDEVARRTFQTVRRGFDPREVREYLHYVADGLRLAGEREGELENLLAAANARAESPEITDEMLAQALGSETGRVLQTAHEAARDIVARAEARAAELIGEASTVLERRQTEAETEAAQIIATASAELESGREALRAETVRLLESTKSDCREMVAEAREVRARILQDLSARRKTIGSQIDQLLAGRLALLTALGGVRDSVEELTERLARGLPDEAIHGEEAAPRELTDEEIASDLARDDANVDAGLAPAPAVTAEEELPAGDATAGAEQGGGTAEGASDGQAPAAVDELFAKIRASRADEVAHAREVLGASGPDSAGGGEAASASSSSSETGVGDGHEAAAALVGETAASGETVAVADDSAAEPEATDSETEAALARRDELLEPALSQLARSLKRALQDDQNELQDRLRQAPLGSVLDDVFALEEQRTRISNAAVSGIEAAWIAGGQFAGARAKGGSPKFAAEAASEAALESALRLADEVCETLRPRISVGLSELGGEGDKSLNDVIGAAYRDLKGTRLEGIAGDHATSAFAGGEVAALTRKRGPQLAVAWVVDDGGSPCPDCADNALAGEQQLGDSFPTGQAYPPAHPGCRCVLVPAR